jgi:hypothetical protein
MGITLETTGVALRGGGPNHDPIKSTIHPLRKSSALDITKLHLRPHARSTRGQYKTLWRILSGKQARDVSVPISQRKSGRAAARRCTSTPDSRMRVQQTAGGNHAARPGRPCQQRSSVNASKKTVKQKAGRAGRSWGSAGSITDSRTGGVGGRGADASRRVDDPPNPRKAYPSFSFSWKPTRDNYEPPDPAASPHGDAPHGKWAYLHGAP